MGSAKQQRFRYDVFISYSHHNREWVHGWLLPQLKGAGLKVCIDHESFEPGAPSVTEIERAVLQSRKTIAVLTPEYLEGGSGWTEFENILVQTPDPAARRRRLIPLLFIDCEPPPRLGSLTSIDFTQSAARSSAMEKLITTIRRRLVPGRKPRAATTINLSFEVPDGVMSPDSPIYIEREGDHKMQEQMRRKEGGITHVEGARQMGKSSLVTKALARAQSCLVVDFDFQSFDEQSLESLESLLRYLAEAIHGRLKLVISPEETWQGPYGSKEKLTSYISDHVLQEATMPVVMVMDEVDRVFGRVYQNDFFGLLRFWHNRRARDPLWRKLHLVLAYATDLRQAIRDLRQSPFNVGSRIKLRDFSLAEVEELNRRYGRPLKNKAQLQGLMGTIGGHPYLVQQALYALATGTHSLHTLVDTDNAADGPFADHLRQQWYLLSDEPELQRAMQQVLRKGSCPNYGVFLQLQSVGLVTGRTHHAVTPRCRLYAAYLQEVLS